MIHHFGAAPSKEDLEKYSQSKNWDGKKFVNLEPTTMDISLGSLPELFYRQFFNTQDRTPSYKLPIAIFDREAFLSPADKMKFIWYGHSVVLMRMHNKTLLIDPMLGPTAAPIAPFATNRFSDNTLSLIADLPEIDLLLLTHDHYDHLDFESLQKLKTKVKKYFVALGVGRHLVKWGIDKSLITEFDWWDHHTSDGIKITFTPSRHFSGRGLTDRAKSLWGGWTFRTGAENIWFSGDGGYGRHFKEIGEREGPFDFAFMECGQYNQQWRQIHMFPEESVQAGLDGRALAIMPVHWAGFSLAQHTWMEPVDRFVAECLKLRADFTTPSMGQLITVGQSPETSPWWRGVVAVR